MECEIHELKTYMSKCGADQPLLVPHLFSISISKILLTEFMTWKFRKI